MKSYEDTRNNYLITGFLYLFSVELYWNNNYLLSKV